MADCDWMRMRAEGCDSERSGRDEMTQCTCFGEIVFLSELPLSFIIWNMS